MSEHYLISIAGIPLDGISLVVLALIAAFTYIVVLNVKMHNMMQKKEQSQDKKLHDAISKLAMKIDDQQSSPTVMSPPRSPKLSPRHQSQDAGTSDAQITSQFDTQDSEKKIFRICVTGGPCAGKTTSLQNICTEFTERGFRVLMVPEAATLMMKGGCFIQTNKMSFLQAVKFQISVMRMQIHLEDVFNNIAVNSDSDCVVVMDRGVMDGRAYMNQNLWHAVLDETGWNEIQLRDKRYDTVIHLVTAADGAEEFYSLSNEARYESVADAKRIDKNLIDSWSGHPHHFIIGNQSEGGFKQKMNRVMNAVLQTVGLVQNAAEQRKFLLKRDAEGKFIFNDSIETKVFNVEEMILKLDNPSIIEQKVRSRGIGESHSYGVETREIKNGQRITSKRQISAREYVQLMDLKDDEKNVVEKSRHTFIHNNICFIIDHFQSIKGQPCILRYESEEREQKVPLPPFVRVVREVTDEKCYQTGYMARLDYKMPDEDYITVYGKEPSLLLERKDSTNSI